MVVGPNFGFGYLRLLSLAYVDLAQERCEKNVIGFAFYLMTIR